MVDERGDPLCARQLALRVGGLVPVDDGGGGVQAGVRQLAGIGGGDDDLLHPLEGQPVGELRHADPPYRGLTTRHGDGVVVEDLERHGHAGGHGAADGQGARVEEGAIAQVLGVVPVSR